MAKHYDNIIILMEIRYLAYQTLENFKNYLGCEYAPILISIDGKRNIEDINSSTYDYIDIIINY